MFVRPEAEVVLFAEELFVTTSPTTTTRDPKAPLEGPEEE